MECAEQYPSDLLFFFKGRSFELSLYEQLFSMMEDAFPICRVKVQKSQISFYCPRLFAAASLPVRRKKGWPERCLSVTFGLSHRDPSPRIAVATEPYPGRWTHHVLLSRSEDVDGQLLSWLQEAYRFARTK